MHPTTTDPRPEPRRRTLPAHSEKPFQLTLLVGAPIDQGTDLADAARVVGPGPVLTVEDAVAAFAAANLSPADLRAKTIVLVDGDPAAAAVTYAVIVGFASRYPDVATPTGVVLADRYQYGRSLIDAGKAPVRPDLVVLVGPGSSVPHDLPTRVIGDAIDEPVVRVHAFTDGSLDHLSAAEVSELRSARRVALCQSSDSEAGFSELLVVAGVRARKEFERLPVLVHGDIIIDLDEVRRAGAALRKEHRGYTAALAPTLDPTERQSRLMEASAVEIREVLTSLGSESTNELWQCPRPWSHTHGDATASMQVSDENRVRCYVDDAEWIDPVRLIMEVCHATPDEAASLLLSGPSAFDPIRDRILAERARRNA